MSEVNWRGHLANHADSYLDMTLRSRFSGAWCSSPVDFNVEGLLKIQDNIELASGDTVLDVGCSSGNPIMKAEQEVKTGAKFKGLDPSSELHDYFLPVYQTGQFEFIEGQGEKIPLKDNSVKALSAHNVLFRAQDGLLMLNEFLRVTEPGGIIVISTNGINHAPMRHEYEKVVARALSEMFGFRVTPPPTPAEGYFFETLPQVVQLVSGLKIIDSVIQRGETIITRDRVPQYLASIIHTVNRTNLANSRAGRLSWREHVHKLIKPLVDQDINMFEELNREAGIQEEPYTGDPVERGMIVIRNEK